MQLGYIPPELQPQILDFFQRFSRFEFALKEARYWRSHTANHAAGPGWSDFVAAHEGAYAATPAALALEAANPKKQVVAAGAQSLEFRDLVFDAGTSDLAKAVRFVRTVRNNLFHGGKHDQAGWDDPKRIGELLPLTIAVLNELASLDPAIEADYPGAY